MSVELVLARFARKRKDALVIPRLASVARSVLKDLGHDEEDVFVPSGGDVVQIDLPGGTTEIRSDSAEFPIQALDSLTVRMVYEIAKAGDMVVLTEGGKYVGILTDVSQRARLPRDWQRPKVTPVCQSTEQLEQLLQGWYEVHNTYARKAFDKPPAGKPGRKTRKTVAQNLLSTSQVVHLHRFDRSANPNARHPKVLRDLLRAANAILKAEKAGKGSVVMGRFNDEFKIKLPTGSADVFSNRAAFDVVEVDALMARMMFEIARSGDMAIIVRKPTALHTILTDRNQTSRVPEGWGEHENSVTLCESPEALVPLLRCRLELDLPPDQRAKFPPQDTWAPGTWPEPRPEFIYVEAQPKETASNQQKKLFRFHRDRSRRMQNPPCEPGSRGGILTSEFWKLESPEGTIFYSYGYSGEKEWWLSMIREFASAEGRGLGRIVNFDTLVLDNGRRFSITACRFAKVWE